MQTVRAFEESIRVAFATRRAELFQERLRAIASHRAGDRPGRAEPRAKKRRPKPHRLLTVPRCEARKQLMQKT